MTSPFEDGSGAVADVEALVVAYHAAPLLDTCLGRLDGGLPVLVVDNSSDPEVRAVAERHRADYVDAGRNLGFAAGVNLGLSKRSYPSADLLLLNPDASIGPSEIATLRECLRHRDDLACVAPAQSDPIDAIPDRVVWPFPTPLGAWLDAVGLGRLARRSDFLIGSVLLLRSEALRDVGGFDERFFLYAEETDWQRRATDRGWSVALCDDVEATHVGAGTGGDEQVRETHFHASVERYVRKHHGSAGWGVFRTGVIAGSAVRALALPRERSAGAALRLRLYLRGPCRTEEALPAPR